MQQRALGGEVQVANPEVMRRLVAVHLACVASQARFDAGLAKLLALWRSRGTQVLLLKGMALRRRIYPLPGLRPLVDGLLAARHLGPAPQEVAAVARARKARLAAALRILALRRFGLEGDGWLEMARELASSLTAPVLFGQEIPFVASSTYRRRVGQPRTLRDSRGPARRRLDVGPDPRCTGWPEVRDNSR